MIYLYRNTSSATDTHIGIEAKARNNPQRYIIMCVISPHNSAGIVSLVWCQIVKFFPVPNAIYFRAE
jgi:hypothetical protein